MPDNIKDMLPARRPEPTSGGSVHICCALATQVCWQLHNHSIQPKHAQRDMEHHTTFIAALDERIVIAADGLQQSADDDDHHIKGRSEVCHDDLWCLGHDSAVCYLLVGAASKYSLPQHSIAGCRSITEYSAPVSEPKQAKYSV